MGTAYSAELTSFEATPQVMADSGSAGGKVRVWSDTIAAGTGDIDDDDIISGINVTPLVDIMLVLLIIFMVTAPLLTVGVQVDLPESSADSLPEEAEPLTLTINSKGEIIWDILQNLLQSYTMPMVGLTWACTSVQAHPRLDGGQ